MRIREAQKHPDPQHCLLVCHDEGFEEAEGDVVMEEGEDETKKKEKTVKKKKKKDAVETAGGKSTSGTISKVKSVLWIGIVVMPIRIRILFSILMPIQIQIRIRRQP